MSTKTIVGLPGQTIFDFALQLYGDMEGLDMLIRDNGTEDMPTETNDFADLAVVYRPGVFVNKAVVDYYDQPITSY